MHLTDRWYVSLCVWSTFDKMVSGQIGFSLLDLQEERQCSMCRASNRLTQLLMCLWKGKEFCTNLFGNQGHYPIVYYKHVQFDSTAASDLQGFCCSYTWCQNLQFLKITCGWDWDRGEGSEGISVDNHLFMFGTSKEHSSGKIASPELASVLFFCFINGFWKGKELCPFSW